MMGNSMKKLVWLAPVVSLAACATPAPNYDPVLGQDPTLTPVSTAVIYEDTLPENARGFDVPIDYSAMNNAAMNAAYANPNVSPAAGAAGGLIGMMIVAAVDASIDANRNGRIRSLIEEQGFDAEATFNAQLFGALTADGLSLDRRAGERNDNGARNDTASINSDAVIDVTVRDYGFIIGTGGGWSPFVNTEVRMTNAATGEVLVDDTILVGVEGIGSRAILPLMDPRYTNRPLKDYLEDNPEMAIEALRYALEITADAAADILIGEVSSEGEAS